LTESTVLSESPKAVSFEKLPGGSLLRLYLSDTWGNSFALDGFPAVGAGESWLGRLGEILRRQGALNMTTNQTLFRQLVDTGQLDGALRRLKAEGRPVAEIYWTLYNEAATTATDLFAPIHRKWPWEGRVSQEASALLSEKEALVRDVLRIGTAMAGVGAFTKVPNVPAGPAALREVLSPVDSPVSPNITLVFSDAHYLDAVEGTLEGLAERLRNLKAEGIRSDRIRTILSRIHSVNSLFVSRVDRAVDPMIDEAIAAAKKPADQAALKLLKGKSAVAQAKLIFRMFEAIFLSRLFEDPEGLFADAAGRQTLKRIERLRDLFELLEPEGAQRQRLLIASSGVKSEQPYSPLLYVLPFLGPWTANTMPEGTLAATSRFVEGLSGERVAALKSRSLMREPIPAIPTDTPAADWDRAVLADARERMAAGIPEISPDRILAELNRRVLAPRKTTLRMVGDTLRDQGAASFRKDEETTLQILQTKLNSL